MKASLKQTIAGVVIFLFVVIQGWAKPVDLDHARTVGQTFLAAYHRPAHAVHSDSADLKLTFVSRLEGLESPDSGHPELYLFVAEGGGFVIVAGDDVASPILGYSGDSRLDPDDPGPAFIFWIEGFRQQIRRAVKDGVDSDPVTASEWQALEDGRLASPHDADAVAPLLRTKWGQFPYYNELCPYDAARGERAVTGCVATAMAQIMKHWNHPRTGVGSSRYSHPDYGTLSADYGSTTYRWNEMPNQLGSGSSSSQRSAVATLMSHSGVSVQMGYGVDGSGISDIRMVVDSLTRYFDYSRSASQVKKNESSDSLWKAALRSELSASRPVLYVGFSPKGEGGHAWVCDGYDRNGLFHMNWGWDGIADGYFALTALTAAGSDYTSEQLAIIGIVPNGNASTSALELSEAIAVSSNPISAGDPFSVHVNVRNSGNAPFSGWVAVGIFDASNNYVEQVALPQQINGLGQSAAVSGGLSFSTNGLPNLKAGSYTLKVMYNLSGTEEWLLAGDRSFSNRLSFTIESKTSGLELYAPLSVGNDWVLIQNTPFDLSFNILNSGGSDFRGQVDVDFFNLDGSWRSDVGTVYHRDIDSLASGYRYSNNLSTRVPGVDLNPGEYLVAVTHRQQGTSNWLLTESGAYSNPVRVWVQAGPDSYEPNDDEVTLLPVTFSGNSARIKTQRASIHHEEDWDFFAIDLPEGHDYRIDARVHDSWQAGDGVAYTADVLWVMVGSDDYSGVFDDVMDAPHILANGGVVVFGVAGWGANVGSYSLEIAINRLARGAGAGTDARAYSIPLYRFHRGDNNSHFFTANVNERDYLIANTANGVWTYEGPSHRVLHTQVQHSTPVYRLYNSRAGSHFYSASLSEIASIQQTMGSWFTVEGIAFYALAGPVDGALPVYRFYSPGTASHFFTISEAEKRQIIATIPSSQLRYEGIAWYAFP